MQNIGLGHFRQQYLGRIIEFFIQFRLNQFPTNQPTNSTEFRDLLKPNGTKRNKHLPTIHYPA